MTTTPDTPSKNTVSGLMADIGIVVAVIAVSALGGLVSGGSSDPWYAALTKPPLTPPGIAFGIVWPVLYLLMAVGAIMVRRSSEPRDKSIVFGLFFLQLALNLAWSMLFFFFHRPEFALLNIIALWLCVALMMLEFWKFSKLATILQIPYLAWLSFAAYLNGGIIWLNG